jgi:hypothetical protein
LAEKVFPGGRGGVGFYPFSGGKLANFQGIGFTPFEFVTASSPPNPAKKKPQK